MSLEGHNGGRLLPGIEDDQQQPPADQRIPIELPDTLRRSATPSLRSATSTKGLVGNFNLSKSNVHWKIGKTWSELIDRQRALFGRSIKRRYDSSVNRRGLRPSQFAPLIPACADLFRKAS